MNVKSWYASNGSADQAIIIDEKTGANIAVVYDKVNRASLIAAAPDMLEALIMCRDLLEDIFKNNNRMAIVKANEAIEKAMINYSIEVRS